MKIDVNNLLNLEYLNNFKTQLNDEITKIKSQFLELYSLEYLKSLSLDEVRTICSKNEVACNSLLEYFEKDFIDSEWEFADLFQEDIQYSSQLNDNIKKEAIKEIDALNAKIILINEGYQKSINEFMKQVEFVDMLIMIITENQRFTWSDIENIKTLLLTSKYDDVEKYTISSSIVRYLIENKKELSVEEVVETYKFEKLLNELYETSSYDEEIIDDKVYEPVYSETVLSYYNYYKKLFDELDLGSTLAQVINTSEGLANGIRRNVNSISKEEFCVELASLLGMLQNAQNNTNEELKSSVLMDLSVLDRFDKENSELSSFKEETLGKIDDDLSLILSLNFTGLFKDKIKNRLNLLRNELRNNIITIKRKNEISSEYDLIKKEMKQLAVINIQINEFNKLKNKIVKLLSVSSLPSGRDGDEYYSNLSKLNDDVLLLVGSILENGPLQNFEVLMDKFNNIILNYTGGNKNDLKIDMKGFVLFEVDENNNTYVVQDLDLHNKNNLIDDSVPRNKLGIAFADYSKLINDLLLYGDIEILLHGVPPKIDDILDHVYYDKNRKHPTGMVRMRPLGNSLVRFMTHKILLRPGTKLFDQVTGLIQEELPNVRINKNEVFNLYINFGSVIKKISEDAYNVVIKRYDAHGILYKLFIDKDNDNVLTDEEILLLKEIIKMSLNSYVVMSKQNEYLKFDVIQKMGVNKSRG